MYTHRCAGYYLLCYMCSRKQKAEEMMRLLEEQEAEDEEKESQGFFDMMFPS